MKGKARAGTGNWCPKCELELKWHTATPKRPFQYRMSGLENIYLAGVEVGKCPRCGVETAIVPHVPALLEAIAWHLFNKPGLLTGEEVRYMRKHGGRNGKEFAKLIGVSPEHLSRVENQHEGRGTLSEGTDRLVRLWGIALGSQEPDFVKLANEILSPERKAPARANQITVLRRKNGAWGVDKAA